MTVGGVRLLPDETVFDEPWHHAPFPLLEGAGQTHAQNEKNAVRNLNYSSGQSYALFDHMPPGAPLDV